MPKPPKVDFSRVPQEVILKKGETLKLDVPFVGKGLSLLTLVVGIAPATPYKLELEVYSYDDKYWVQKLFW